MIVQKHSTGEGITSCDNKLPCKNVKNGRVTVSVHSISDRCSCIRFETGWLRLELCERGQRKTIDQTKGKWGVMYIDDPDG